MHLSEAGIGDPEVRVVLSWLRFRNATQGVPPWIPAEAVSISGETFALEVRAPPPPDALIPASGVPQPDDMPVDGSFAVGVLSAVMVAPWGAVRMGPDPGRPAHGGGRRPRTGGLGGVPKRRDSAAPARPGLQRSSAARGFSHLEAQVPGIVGDSYVVRRLDDVELWPDGGLPDWEFCQDRVPSQAVPTEFDSGFLPESDTIVCACDLSFFETQCARAFGLLCRQCGRERFWAPAPFPDEWPCIPEGRQCRTPDEYFCGPDGLPYTCLDGEWGRDGEDCDRACVEG